MELLKADLQAFADDVKLAGLAELTIKGYVDQLRRYSEWCSKEGLHTATVRSARSYLVTLSKWSGYMCSRALKRFGKWLAKEYDEPDPFASLEFVAQPKPTPQRTASSSDIAALLLSIGGSDLRALRDRALVLTLGTSGLRRAELARMKWTDHDLGSGVSGLHVANLIDSHK